jgi:hypothetical protein
MTGLGSLPEELILNIFSYLCPVHSACLGLTCKRFYKHHRELHGRVALDSRCPAKKAWGLKLYDLLEEWHPPGFVYCWCGRSQPMAIAAVVRPSSPDETDETKRLWTDAGQKKDKGDAEGRTSEKKCERCEIRILSKPTKQVKITWLYP